MTGILQLFTLGGLGAWTLIDLVLILSNNFYDKEGRSLKDYNLWMGLAVVVLMIMVLGAWGKTFSMVIPNFFSPAYENITPSENEIDELEL